MSLEAWGDEPPDYDEPTDDICACGNLIDAAEVETRDYSETEDMCAVCFEIASKHAGNLEMARLG